MVALIGAPATAITPDADAVTRPPVGPVDEPPAPADAEPAPPVRHLSHLVVLRQVARRGVPHLVEATLVPALLFYAFMLTLGVFTAFLGALLWSYGAIARRFLTGRSIPPVLVLSTVALTVRTAIALASGSTFIYFFQPILGTLAMAGVFLGSIAMGQPLIAKLAGDFWPLTPDVAAHPAVVRLFRGLTVLWAGVYAATAVVTFTLLLTMPTEHFVPAKMLTGYVITLTGIVVTIAWSIATARREGLTHLVHGAL
jgi:intracellular septation protein A